MKDYFICNHLTYKKDFCTFYGKWNSNIIEDCKECDNKNCEKCSNKNSNILEDNKWTPCCSMCVLKR